MPRQRTIVGIGEALLCEYPDRTEPGGIALLSAIHAAQIGHVGIPISRIGQDAQADELLAKLNEHSLDTSHIQSDPDLATGRLIVRKIGFRSTQTVQPRAAFDNIQWDFDLADVAQQTDGVIFGEFARRQGQSRSVMKRFLEACTNAIRVFDLTNREDETIDRGEARSGAETANVLVVDDAALKILAPGAQNVDTTADLSGILKKTASDVLIFVQTSEGSEHIIVFDSEGKYQAPRPIPSDCHHAAIVAILHGMLGGWDFPRSLESARSFADHVAQNGHSRFEMQA